jgi:hypothetical protein
MSDEFGFQRSVRLTFSEHFVARTAQTNSLRYSAWLFWRLVDSITIRKSTIEE